jgi:DNA modification methylase
MIERSLRFIPDCPLADLRPFDRNPRKNDAAVEAVEKSLSQFGPVAPIIVDGDFRICAGHTRYKAATQQGLSTFPVLVAPHLVGDDFKAYNIADNQTASIAEWDTPELAAIIQELQDADYDFSVLGFNAEEFNEIMASIDGPPVNPNDPDDVPEPPVDPISKTGDLWLLGDHRLLCGDATVAADVDKLMGGAKPFLMVTDPPYGVEYDPGWRNGLGGAQIRATGRVVNDSRSDWRDAWSLSPCDVAYIWHAGLHVLSVAESLLACDYIIRAQIIWAKQMAPISRGAYRWQHEPCFYAVRNGRTSKFIDDHSQTTLWEIANLNTVGGKSKEAADAEATGHGTQKPVECMARPIRNHGGKDDHVYDPFVGSGTTVIACEQLGRKCYAMEIEPKYVDVAVKRWEQFTGKQAELAR